PSQYYRCYWPGRASGRILTPSTWDSRALWKGCRACLHHKIFPAAAPPAGGENREGFSVAMRSLKTIFLSLFVLLLAAPAVHASEANLAIPDLWEHGSFTLFGQKISAGALLLAGSVVICGTLGISLYLRAQIHKLPSHKSMLSVAETIFQTC